MSIKELAEQARNDAEEARRTAYAAEKAATEAQLRMEALSWFSQHLQPPQEVVIEHSRVYARIEDLWFRWDAKSMHLYYTSGPHGDVGHQPACVLWDREKNQVIRPSIHDRPIYNLADLGRALAKLKEKG